MQMGSCTQGLWLPITREGKKYISEKESDFPEMTPTIMGYFWSTTRVELYYR